MNAGPAALARVRRCLDAAEASVGWPAAGASASARQRHYAAQHEANASALAADGFTALAATYRETARGHEDTAARIEREEQGLQKKNPGTEAGAEGGARSPRNGGEVARG